MPDNGWTYLYTCINLWTTMKFGFSYSEIRRNHKYISTGCLIFNVGPKRCFLLRIICLTFLTRLSEMLDFFGGWHFHNIFRRIQKSLNIACSMSQSVTNWHNKNVAPFSGIDSKKNLPLILNTDLFCSFVPSFLICNQC